MHRADCLRVFSKVIFILKNYTITALSIIPVTAVWLRGQTSTEDT